MAYLRLNIFMGIHRLPQLDMFWDSDEFIGVEGFKKLSQSSASKLWENIYIWMNRGDEEANDALCKVQSLVTLLEDKFPDVYIPGKKY